MFALLFACFVSAKKFRDCEECEKFFAKALEKMDKETFLASIKTDICKEDDDKCQATVKAIQDVIRDNYDRVTPRKICEMNGICRPKAARRALGNRVRKAQVLASYPNCDYCKNVLNYLFTDGENAATDMTYKTVSAVCEDEIKQFSQSMVDLCDKFTVHHALKLVQMISGSYAPQQLCQAGGLCA